MATYPLTDRAILLRPEDDVAIAKTVLAAGTVLFRGVPARGRQGRHAKLCRRHLGGQLLRNVIGFTTGRGSVFGCKLVPSIKLATNSLMYRHLEEDMDVNCGVIVEGTPLPTVGRQIFEEIVAVASGKRTKSELSGVGEEEFAPWIIGPVM